MRMRSNYSFTSSQLVLSRRIQLLPTVEVTLNCRVYHETAHNVLTDELNFHPAKKERKKRLNVNNPLFTQWQ